MVQKSILCVSDREKGEDKKRKVIGGWEWRGKKTRERKKKWNDLKFFWVLLSLESIQGRQRLSASENGTRHANCDFAFIVRKTQASQCIRWLMQTVSSPICAVLKMISECDLVKLNVSMPKYFFTGWTSSPDSPLDIKTAVLLLVETYQTKYCHFFHWIYGHVTTWNVFLFLYWALASFISCDSLSACGGETTTV